MCVREFLFGEVICVHTLSAFLSQTLIMKKDLNGELNLLPSTALSVLISSSINCLLFNVG